MSGQEQAPVFAIQRVYLKGMSLEMPNAPEIFLQSQQPTVELAVDVVSEPLAEALHETGLRVTLTTRVGDNVAFLVEIEQAGIFEVRNVPGDQMDVLLYVVCANIVFPYLRANLADVIQRTGFPPRASCGSRLWRAPSASARPARRAATGLGHHRAGRCFLTCGPKQSGSLFTSARADQ